MGNIRFGLVTVMLVGCSDGSGPAANACPQTHEFGNFGCARIRGTVRDAAGTPMSGARVSVAPPSGSPNSYDLPSSDTDATGSYALEIHNYGPQPQATPADTVPMYLRAFLLGAGTAVGDSVLVEMIFVPVGVVPEVAGADITLN